MGDAEDDRPGMTGMTDRTPTHAPGDGCRPSLPERLAGDDIASVRRRMVGRLLLVANEDGSLTIDGELRSR